MSRPRRRHRRSGAALRDERPRVRAPATCCPYQDEWERTGELPRTLHARAARLGLLGVGFPAAVGGGGGDAVDALVLAEELHEAGAAGGVFAACSRPASPCRTSSRPATRRSSTAGSVRRWPAIDRVAGHHRTRRRLRRRRPPHHAPCATATHYRRQRRQDLHHLRHPRRLRRHRGADRRAGCARDLAACRREGHARVHRQSRGWRRWAGCAPTPPNCPTSTSGCRRPTWSAPRTPASPRSRSTSSVNGSRWPCRPTPARNAAST